VSIVVTQAGVVGGEDLVGTFSGEGAFSDGEVSLLPVHVEGGFRAKKHADVDAPR